MYPRIAGKLLPLVLTLLLALSGLGFMRPERAPLPNFDKRRTSQPSPEQQTAARQSRDQFPDLRVDFDRITGTPRSVSVRNGFLAPRNPTNSAAAASIAPIGVATLNEHAPTRSFLNANQPLFGHGSELLEQARITRDFTGAHNGLRTVVWAQELEGVEIFEALLISHTTPQGELVNLSSHFIPDAATAADRGTPNRAALLQTPAISSRRAAVLTAQNLGAALDEAQITTGDAAPDDAAKKHTFSATPFLGDASARFVWLPVDRTHLRLCWEIVATSRSRSETFRVLVDAQSGEVLLRRCLTDYLTDATFNVFTSDSPSPFSPSTNSSTSTNQPAVISRTLVTLAALDTNASPAGWIPDGGNTTLGNNVDAHTDRNGNNVNDEARPTGSPARTFDFTLNLALDPTNHSAASVVQLFYWNNWVHDKLYQLGFTEAAGNFQSNNFARGGYGGDAVQADAQDGSGYNNANFTTFTDGNAPRMQMYLFSVPTPKRDGDLDAEIVIHEYCHGLSNRRVGGGVGISTTQSAGMGEGWSDFYALALLSEPSDDTNGNYAMGGYATYQFLTTSYRVNYYFGIRRYPYSTDLTKNPLTFKDIDPAQASAHPGVPLSPNPLFTPFNAADANEVHNAGEVWCVTLWEMRANLVAAHGWTNGNQLALQLVTDGLNLAPANPDFLEARDAILQADLVNNSGANSNALWAAFAKRGMGFSAICPNSTTTDGIVEAFDLPNALRVSPWLGMVAKGPLGGPFTNTQTLVLSNASPTSLNWSAANVPAWLLFSPSNGTLAANAATSVLASVGAAANSQPYGIHPTNVTFTNLTDGGGPTRLFKLLAGARDYFTTGIEGTNPLQFTTFTFTPDNSDAFYAVCRTTAGAFPTDPAGGTNVSLADDSYVMVTLASTNKFGIYGQRTNRFFIGSNGYITTGSGDDSYLPTYATHFSLPRIAGNFTDMNPPGGGTISWRELPDRVAITYDAVPEYGDNSMTNSFQIELLFDNRIRVTFLKMSTSYAIAGLSGGGGTPLIFDPSDFTAYCDCLYPPLITSDPTNQTVLVGTAADFNVSAVGTQLNYSWRKNGTNLTGETNATLHFAAAQVSDAADYTVIVTNFAGSATSAVAVLTVTNLPPVPDFAGDPLIGLAPLTVTFTNLSTEATNYYWTFGDGNTSTLANPANTYSNAGTYDVTLTAIGAGGTNVLTQPGYIVVTNPPAPAVNFTANTTAGLAPLTVTFTNLTIDATSYAWDFGDGNFSALADPVNTFSNAGSYSVTLTATGPGGTNFITLPAYILATNLPTPVALFEADITNGLAPLTVAFTNLSTEAASYLWDFGDGNSSSDVNPVNTFTNAGSYTVMLTAIGPGGTNVLAQTNYIVATNFPPPVADFVSSRTNGYAPFTVCFTNTCANATNYAWDFGDGNFSVADNATNTFTNPGQFTVQLTATGSGGTNSLARTNYIYVASPPQLAARALDGANFIFSFPSLEAWTYTVQFKDSLDDTTWQSLPPPLPGTGGWLNFTNAPPGQMRFYRLLAE